MPEAVRRARLAFTVDAEIFLVEDGFEKLSLPLGKNRSRRFGRAPFSARNRRCLGLSSGRVRAINARRAEPASKSLEGQHRTRHTLAISNSTFSPDLDLQNRLFQVFVENDRDIAELKTPGLVWPQSGIHCEEDIIVELLRFPFEAASLGGLGTGPCRVVELFVFFW